MFNIVVGLRRSGTSMTMLAIRTAGIPIIGFKYTVMIEKDDTGKIIMSSIPSKKLKKGNPNGYWEIGTVTVKTGIQKEFVDLGMKGDVIKIVADCLYKSAPEMIDKTVFIVRNPRCVITSMRKAGMFKDEDIVEFIERHKADLTKTVEFLKENKLPYLKTKYEDLLDNPLAEMTKVCEFLGRGNPELGASVINKDLNRSKPCEGDYEGLKELEEIIEKI